MHIFVTWNYSFEFLSLFILKILKTFFNGFLFEWKTKWKTWLLCYVSKAACIIKKSFQQSEIFLENLGFYWILFLEQRSQSTINSITIFLSLLNCVDSVDACVTWVTRASGYVSDMYKKLWKSSMLGGPIKFSRESIKFWRGSINF